MDSPSEKDSLILEIWQRFMQGVLGVLLLAGAGLMVRFYAPPQDPELAQRVHQLTHQVEELQRQQSQPLTAVNDARESVAYIYGIYHISSRVPGQSFRARVGGTGFVVASGLLATNRH